MTNMNCIKCGAPILIGWILLPEGYVCPKCVILKFKTKSTLVEHLKDKYVGDDPKRRGWIEGYTEACRDIAAENSEHARERLADYAHDAWSGWMKYLFGKCYVTTLGTAIMPKWAVEQWHRQMNTKYADLSEEEKDSDRKEADRMLKIVSGNSND